MKKFNKILCMALALACILAFFAVSTPAAQAADSDYEPFPLKSKHMLYPSHYYPTADCTGEPIKHTFIKVPSGYPSFACDNNNNSGLTGQPIKFNDLIDNGGSKVPTCVIDLALGGDPVKIAGFGLTLRSHFDCEPLHIQIQVSTDAAGTNWKTVFDKDNIQWDGISNRWYFDETDAYMVRLLALQLDEVDISAEGTYYDKIQGDETRFAYSEVDVFVKKAGGSTGNGGGNTSTPNNPGQSATRPGIVLPTRPASGDTPTQPATKAPTQPATKAPTQPATQAPTQPATKAPTQPATQAPSQVVTTPGATEPAATTPVATEPTATVDPNAPTEEPTVEPTVDPSAPTEEPTVAPTEEPTQAPTVEATEPEATTPTTDTGAEQTPDNTWIIIVAIVAAVVIAGGAIFFIIKKKKA